MTWESEFDEFLTDEVTREEYTGQNDYGEPSFGGAVTLKARVVYKPELVATGAGQISSTVSEVVSTAKVYCSGVPQWGNRDRITLPDGSQPVILAVHTYPDETGEHHQVLVF